MPPLRDQLDHLVDEMVTKGVRFEDANREFEKRFIKFDPFKQTILKY